MTIYSQCSLTGNSTSPYVQHINFCGDINIEDFLFFQENGEVSFIYQDPVDNCLRIRAEILMPISLDLYVTPDIISKFHVLKIETLDGPCAFTIEMHIMYIWRFIHEYLIPAIKDVGEIKDKHEYYVLLRRTLEAFRKSK